MSSKLAKMIATGEPEYVDIAVYYTYVKNRAGSEALRCLDDEDAKKMLEDPAKKDLVEVLNSNWKQANWREQNEILNECYVHNMVTNRSEVDWNKYRERRIKTLLSDWDLTYNNQKVPVSESAIDRLPAEIVVKMYDKYESAVTIDEEQRGK